MSSSSGHELVDCEMKDLTQNQETRVICFGSEMHSQPEQEGTKKRKANEERVCVSCKEILSKQTACQSCSGCCRSIECRTGEHIMVRAIREKERKVEEIRQQSQKNGIELSPTDAWKLADADPRSSSKRTRSGELQKETKKSTDHNQKQIKTKEPEKPEKKPEKEAEKKRESAEKKSKKAVSVGAESRKTGETLQRIAGND